MIPRKCKFKPMAHNENGVLERKSGKFKDGIMYDVMRVDGRALAYMVEDMRGFVYCVHFTDIRFTDTAENYADKLKKNTPPRLKDLVCPICKATLAMIRFCGKSKADSIFGYHCQCTEEKRDEYFNNWEETNEE